jgi:hypothetical protein
MKDFAEAKERGNISPIFELIEKQVIELTELYTFLKTLRCKLELWDCRYDIDTEIEYPEKELKKD